MGMKSRRYRKSSKRLQKGHLHKVKTKINNKKHFRKRCLQIRAMKKQIVKENNPEQDSVFHYEKINQQASRNWYVQQINKTSYPSNIDTKYTPLLERYILKDNFNISSNVEDLSSKDMTFGTITSIQPYAGFVLMRVVESSQSIKMELGLFQELLDLVKTINTLLCQKSNSLKWNERDLENCKRSLSWYLRSILPSEVAVRFGIDLCSNYLIQRTSNFLHSHIYPIYLEGNFSGEEHNVKYFMLKILENEYPRFPVRKIYSKMSGRRNIAGNFYKPSCENDKDGFQRSTSMSLVSWTDLYGPQTISDVFLMSKNAKSINILKSWLEDWKNCLPSSFGETSSRTCNFPHPKVAVLFGECGSGKTISFQVLAEELGYKVFEINLSTGRSWSEILSVLLKACQDKNHHDSDKSQNGDPSSLEVNDKREWESSKIPIIFVEDVDFVVLGEEEDFFLGLMELVGSENLLIVFEARSHKPLKMIPASNVLLHKTLFECCPHLNCLTKPPMVLPFLRNHNNDNIEAFLRIVCLCEGVWVSSAWAKSVTKGTDEDLRKSLMLAQFWAGSVGRSPIQPVEENISIDKNRNNYLKNIDPAAYNVDDINLPNFCGCINSIVCISQKNLTDNQRVRRSWLNVRKLTADFLNVMNTPPSIAKKEIKTESDSDQGNSRAHGGDPGVKCSFDNGNKDIQDMNQRHKKARHFKLSSTCERRRSSRQSAGSNPWFSQLFVMNVPQKPHVSRRLFKEDISESTTDSNIRSDSSCLKENPSELNLSDGKTSSNALVSPQIIRTQSVSEVKFYGKTHKNTPEFSCVTRSKSSSSFPEPKLITRRKTLSNEVLSDKTPSTVQSEFSCVTRSKSLSKEIFHHKIHPVTPSSSPKPKLITRRKSLSNEVLPNKTPNVASDISPSTFTKPRRSLSGDIFPSEENFVNTSHLSNFSKKTPSKYPEFTCITRSKSKEIFSKKIFPGTPCNPSKSSVVKRLSKEEVSKRTLPSDFRNFVYSTRSRGLLEDYLSSEIHYFQKSMPTSKSMKCKGQDCLIETGLVPGATFSKKSNTQRRGRSLSRGYSLNETHPTPESSIHRRSRSVCRKALSAKTNLTYDSTSSEKSVKSRSRSLTEHAFPSREQSVYESVIPRNVYNTRSKSLFQSNLLDGSHTFHEFTNVQHNYNTRSKNDFSIKKLPICECGDPKIKHIRRSRSVGRHSFPFKTNPTSDFTFSKKSIISRSKSLAKDRLPSKEQSSYESAVPRNLNTKRSKSGNLLHESSVYKSPYNTRSKGVPEIKTECIEQFSFPKNTPTLRNKYDSTVSKKSQFSTPSRNQSVPKDDISNEIRSFNPSGFSKCADVGSKEFLSDKADVRTSKKVSVESEDLDYSLPPNRCYVESDGVRRRHSSSDSLNISPSPNIKHTTYTISSKRKLSQDEISYLVNQTESPKEVPFQVSLMKDKSDKPIDSKGEEPNQTENNKAMISRFYSSTLSFIQNICFPEKQYEILDKSVTGLSSVSCDSEYDCIGTSSRTVPYETKSSYMLNRVESDKRQSEQIAAIHHSKYRRIEGFSILDGGWTIPSLDDNSSNSKNNSIDCLEKAKLLEVEGKSPSQSDNKKLKNSKMNKESYKEYDLKSVCHTLEILSFVDTLSRCKDSSVVSMYSNFLLEELPHLGSTNANMTLCKEAIDFETKEIKDSAYYPQPQMFQVGLPAYWSVSNTSLTLDVAPHLRLLCRIDDEKDKNIARRTRSTISEQPLINRFGPVLRQYLANTLKDDGCC